MQLQKLRAQRRNDPYTKLPTHRRINPFPKLPTHKRIASFPNNSGDMLHFRCSPPTQKNFLQEILQIQFELQFVVICLVHHIHMCFAYSEVDVHTTDDLLGIDRHNLAFHFAFHVSRFTISSHFAFHNLAFHSRSFLFSSAQTTASNIRWPTYTQQVQFMGFVRYNLSFHFWSSLFFSAQTPASNVQRPTDDLFHQNQRRFRRTTTKLRTTRVARNCVREILSVRHNFVVCVRRNLLQLL